MQTERWFDIVDAEVYAGDGRGPLDAHTYVDPTTLKVYLHIQAGRHQYVKDAEVLWHDEPEGWYYVHEVDDLGVSTDHKRTGVWICDPCEPPEHLLPVRIRHTPPPAYRSIDAT